MEIISLTSELASLLILTTTGFLTSSILFHFILSKTNKLLYLIENICSCLCEYVCIDRQTIEKAPQIRVLRTYSSQHSCEQTYMNSQFAV